MQAHNYIEAMKKILFTLVLALITLVSCDDVSKADKLRLENKFEEAAELYQKAADEGNAYAKWRLSEAYANGDGVDFDEQEALRLLKEAAEEGCEEAQCDLALAYMFDWYNIGLDEKKGKKMLDALVKKTTNDYVLCNYANILFFGRGVYDEDKSKAVSILDKVKDKGDAKYLYIMACIYANGTDEIDVDDNKFVEYVKKAYEKSPRVAAYSMALVYRDGLGETKRDLKKMEECLKKGIKANSVSCMNELASIYLSDDTAWNNYNPQKGIELYKKAAKHGSGDAYDNLAVLYYCGKELPKDDSMALELWKKATNLGSASGTYNLGYAYITGIGCLKDLKKGEEIWKLAVQRGDGSAANNLYCYYFSNKYGETERDYGLAREYLFEAARLDNEWGCFNLAQHYYSGNQLLNIEKDEGQAFVYAKKAADLGNVDACGLLAYLYKNGIGCRKDPQKAKEYEDKTKAKEEKDSNESN